MYNTYQQTEIPTASAEDVRETNISASLLQVLDCFSICKTENFSGVAAK